MLTEQIKENSKKDDFSGLFDEKNSSDILKKLLLAEPSNDIKEPELESNIDEEDFIENLDEDLTMIDVDNYINRILHDGFSIDNNTD
jgi:hypothetical protein